MQGREDRKLHLEKLESRRSRKYYTRCNRMSRTDLLYLIALKSFNELLQWPNELL